MTNSPDCDLVLVQGNVVTVNPVFSIHRAVGIRGNRIVAVGTDDEVRELIGARTEVVNLAGKTVLPASTIRTRTPRCGPARGLPSCSTSVIRMLDRWPRFSHG